MTKYNSFLTTFHVSLIIFSGKKFKRKTNIMKKYYSHNFKLQSNQTALTSMFFILRTWSKSAVEKRFRFP